MDARPSVLPDARRILQLARNDKRAAEDAVAALPMEEQVALICSSAPSLRGRLLELAPSPEAVIPLLPDAELCFTAKAIGLGDAGWILEHASEGQLVASIDLDAWHGLAPSRENLREWIAALGEAGENTLLRTARALDTELVVLAVRDRVNVDLDPKDEEWQAPEGAVTLEGQFYLTPRRSGDDLADLLKMLHVLFREDYWLYFRIMQGAIWELESDIEEWALRWRTGRLEDLGFPSWDESMRIYGYLRESERDRIPPTDDPLDVQEWDLPVFLPQLPASLAETYSVFGAAAELLDDERRGFFYAFIGISNKVAVADQMSLGDPETLPEAIAVAAAVITQGLEHLATRNELGLTETLRRVSLERLFRVGASLGGRKPLRLHASSDSEPGEDEGP